MASLTNKSPKKATLVFVSALCWAEASKWASEKGLASSQWRYVGTVAQIRGACGNVFVDVAGSLSMPRRQKLKDVVENLVNSGELIEIDPFRFNAKRIKGG